MRELFELYSIDEPLFPMNAKSLGTDKEEKLRKLEQLLTDDDYWAEEKFDGARATTAEGRFFSRHASEDKDFPNMLGFPVENTASIPHLSAAFEQIPGTWFDGEAYLFGKTSDDVTSILGCSPDKALARQIAGGYLNYIVFDLLFTDYLNIMTYSFERRREVLEQAFKENQDIFDQFEKDFKAKIQLSYIAKTTEEKRALLKRIEAGIKAGKLEGLMFKNKKADYRAGKRLEKYWYKYKKGIEADVIIMGFTEGKGKFDGLIGSIEFGQFKPIAKGAKRSGHTIFVDSEDKVYELTNCGSCSGIYDSFRSTLTTNQNAYIGKVIKITAMERTKAGRFRHPQFDQLRTDKSAMQCIWGEG